MALLAIMATQDHLSHTHELGYWQAEVLGLKVKAVEVDVWPSRQPDLPISEECLVNGQTHVRWN